MSLTVCYFLIGIKMVVETYDKDIFFRKTNNNLDWSIAS